MKSMPLIGQPWQSRERTPAQFEDLGSSAAADRGHHPPVPPTSLLQPPTSDLPTATLPDLRFATVQETPVGTDSSCPYHTSLDPNSQEGSGTISLGVKLHPSWYIRVPNLLHVRSTWYLVRLGPSAIATPPQVRESIQQFARFLRDLREREDLSVCVYTTPHEYESVR